MAIKLDTTANIAVIGCGAMGEGIAQVAAVAGHTVLLYDARPDAAATAVTNINNRLLTLVAKKRIGALNAAMTTSRLRPVHSLTEMADVALVIEAIVEDLDIKRKLFSTLEEVVSDECILASNTSSISITALAAQLRLSGRLLGMHFFNPVPLMALVEVISGLGTDRSVADTVHALAIQWGKSPVFAKSTPGFIVNRVARPYYGEALRLLSEQAGDPATLDTVMRDVGGFRMGPFELMDLIGHDVNFAVTCSVFRAYFNDSRYTPSILQQELVDAGFLGRKTGRGFYRYDTKHAPMPLTEKTIEAATDTASILPNNVKILVGQHPIAQQLASRLRVAGLTITDINTAPSTDYLLDINGTLLYLTDGRSATQRAKENDIDNLLLIDLTFDFDTTKRIALCAAGQCDAQAYHIVEQLFLQAGIAVTQLADVPGMAVMRTVAMLANEAADAVNQGVCSAQSADTAMCKGVNYPRGPLAWADIIGLPQLVTVLENLATIYGEDRYRVSPLLRRQAFLDRRFFGYSNEQ